jgi:hypothetical protein
VSALVLLRWQAQPPLIAPASLTGERRGDVAAVTGRADGIQPGGFALARVGEVDLVMATCRHESVGGEKLETQAPEYRTLIAIGAPRAAFVRYGPPRRARSESG